ncbi:MAG: glycosyltransferase family 4 protein [Candidatus Sungbacteria bacterium]|nr:glycosyltransferase family 4 protein [Candidatus Sungbacteria bacterium]
MKLLLITQKVDMNDDVLGFMHGWIAEFSRGVEELTVVCLEERTHSLPSNVRVYSLGKESGASRITYLARFYKIIWRQRRAYDAVFVHMNQMYVLLGGLIWRILGKQIALWYAHGKTSAGLWIAEKIADIVFTSTKSGFRIPSKKVVVVGQGIDIAGYTLAKNASDIPCRIVSVGRISPVKDYETIINAVSLLWQEHIAVELLIIGGVGMAEQAEYLNMLKVLVQEKNASTIVQFLGPRPNREIGAYLGRAQVFVNASRTGSLDKSGLEGMASGLPVFTCNEAYDDVLGPYREALMFPPGDAASLARKIKAYIQMPRQEQIRLGSAMRNIVEQQHALPMLAKNILAHLQTIVSAA